MLLWLLSALGAAHVVSGLWVILTPSALFTAFGLHSAVASGGEAGRFMEEAAPWAGASFVLVGLLMFIAGGGRRATALTRVLGFTLLFACKALLVLDYSLLRLLQRHALETAPAIRFAAFHATLLVLLVWELVVKPSQSVPRVRRPLKVE
jgi:hypothetical protein